MAAMRRHADTRRVNGNLSVIAVLSAHEAVTALGLFGFLLASLPLDKRGDCLNLDLEAKVQIASRLR